MRLKHILGGFALVAAILCLMSESANAQAIYGPDGQYQGMAQTSGNTTNLYNARGELVMSMQTNNDQTSVYGAQGQYRGYIDAPVNTPQSNTFMYITPQVPQVPRVRSF